MSSENEPPQGIALPLAAFEALKDAGVVDEALSPGREALPSSREGAIERARIIHEVLGAAELTQPETYVVAKLPARKASTIVEAVEAAWHVAPLYPVLFSDGRMMKAVVDPFLRPMPLGLLDWQVQLGVHHVELVAASDVVAASDALARTLDEGDNFDATTKRGGTGTAADSHGLAKLLRAWLKDPSDPTQVDRFRALFGDVAWRSLETAYPKLVLEVELELERRRPR